MNKMKGIIIYVEDFKDLEKAYSCKNFFNEKGIVCDVVCCGFFGCHVENESLDGYLKICLLRGVFFTKDCEGSVIIKRNLKNYLRYLFKPKITGIINLEKRWIFVSTDKIHPLITILHEILHVGRGKNSCKNEKCLGNCNARHIRLCPECSKLLDEIFEKYFNTESKY